MMKMELHEVNILLAIIENTQFAGKDVPIIAGLIEKLQKESIKLTPDKVIKGG
jgi:hypothetical protein